MNAGKQKAVDFDDSNIWYKCLILYLGTELTNNNRVRQYKWEENKQEFGRYWHVWLSVQI